MRLWTLHPKYLDSQGLVALWREALLAQAVLLCRTKGYTRHPQLFRFRQTQSPMNSIAAYLRGIYAEAEKRGYRFDRGKIAGNGPSNRCAVTHGQLEYERNHLLAKLRNRDKQRFNLLKETQCPDSHPLFEIVPGGVEGWEKNAWTPPNPGLRWRVSRGPSRAKKPHGPRHAPRP